MSEFTINTLEDLSTFAKNFSKDLKPGDVVCMTGDLGAGKTALVKFIADVFSIKDLVQSPTFNILLQYKNDVMLINHFDLYRLENDQDLDDIGFFETLENGGITFIEWAEKFRDSMPDNAIWLRIEKLSESSRKLIML